MRTGLVGAALLSMAVAPPIALADEVADFYKGKTVSVIVGYSPGGGYDTYARVLAKHIGKYIPGNPTVVIQNMPGAGSLVAANYLYNIAPKDGTAFGTFARNMPLIGMLGTDQNVQFDPRKFTWLGSSSSFANDAYVLITRKDAKAKTLKDAMKPGGPQLLLGSTAEGVSSDAMAIVLRDMLGLNIKLITGYRDSSELYLAMERNEVEGRTTGLSSVLSNKPDWLKKDGPMQVLVVFGRRERHPDFPNAPMAVELAKNENDRALIRFLELPYSLSRPYAAPPGVPPARAKALQAAFLAAHKDPEYLKEAEKLRIDVSPIGGEAVLKLLDNISKMPKEELKKVEKLIGG
ncbi:MAG TPA: tripartite tricarboxylate transporter substrate-binding protein [Hyphomicrobiaceae bacterium]|nr:tripartite tricarboxylate transporter substrate-binding protein [Hyphomicrobiaceae bacterium]